MLRFNPIAIRAGIRFYLALFLLVSKPNSHFFPQIFHNSQHARIATQSLFIINLPEL